MKPINIAILVGIAIFAVVLGVTFSGSTSTYSNFKEAKQSGGRVHIAGEWVNRENAVYDNGQDIFTFYLKDTLGGVEKVIYHDPKPMNFETAEKVVIIGKYDDNGFDAEKIIMKCPSKYEKKELKEEPKKAM